MLAVYERSCQYEPCGRAFRPVDRGRFTQRHCSPLCRTAAGREAVQECRTTHRVLGSPLTAAQWEVLQLAALGMTGPEIAAARVCALNTVKVLLRLALEALDARSTTQAVCIATARGWLAETLPGLPAKVYRVKVQSKGRS